MGFGTPLIAGYHTIAGPRVREYSRPSEMLADGFTVNSPLYKAAAILCSQANKPKTFKIGKCLGAPQHTVTLKLTSSPVGETHSIEVTLPSGTTTTISVTGTGVVNTDAASLNTALDALAESSSTVGTDTVTFVTTTAGSITTFANWTSKIEFQDITADPATSIATDLANIAAEDDKFYGLLLANESEAIVGVAASWANTNDKLFIFCTSDTLCTDSGTSTDVMSDMKALGYDHVGYLYNGKKCPAYAAAAWMGGRFPYVPGKSTWRFKPLVGVPVDSLTVAQRSALDTKRGSYYVSMAGLSIMLGGAKVASGEYIDVIHFLDWLIAEIQFRVFASFVNSDKIPFTDIGIEVVAAGVRGALQAGVTAGGLSPSPAPVVTTPLAADVDSTEKANRNLPGVTFTCTLAGAIHTADVEGTVSL